MTVMPGVCIWWQEAAECIMDGMTSIIDINLKTFEAGSPRAQAKIVDATRSSMQSGFVYVGHDLPTGTDR